MIDYKWVRPNMDLYFIGKNQEHIITISNSGILEVDFYRYAQNFYEAAEAVIHYLLEEAAQRHDIAKLDLWYFATVYLYRQSLELLLKASIFQIVTDVNDRKDIVGKVRHNLKQSFEKLLEVKKLAIGENENAKWLMEYLADISHMDEKSDMFRYPFGNKFKVLFNKQTYISLIATHDNMSKAYMVIKEICDTGAFPVKDYGGYPPQLIIEGGHYYQQSVVGYKYSQNSFYPYFSSYSEVGNFLKDKIILQKQSHLFMPMCYLYKNAIELGLKRVIVEDSHIDQDKAAEIAREKKHSILGLWNSISGEIRIYTNLPANDTTLDDAQRYIQKFQDIDPHSDLFRYPCDKKMKPYFLDAKKFDIENVATCFEELCNFLDAIDSELSEIKDFEAEIESNYDSNFDSNALR